MNGLKTADIYKLRSGTTGCLIAGMTVFVLLFATLYVTEGSCDNGFTRLNEKDCTPITDSLLKNLPEKWMKYKLFTKVCVFKQPDGVAAKISMITIWAQDYFKVKYPYHAPIWEDFPAPLLVNDDWQMIGELPEIFPVDDATVPSVYYDKWADGIPRELQVDVHNPAVEGDYYYLPLLFDDRTGRYQMRSREVIYGRRR